MTQHRDAGLITWVEDIRMGLAVRDVFEIEPDRLPRLRAELRAISDTTRWALESSREFIGIEPPAEDEASLRSTAELRRITTDGDFSFLRGCEEIHTWVTRFLSEVDEAIVRHGLVGASR